MSSQNLDNRSSRDDYARKSQNTAQLDTRYDTEPADPDDPDHCTRRDLPFAPNSAKSNSLPDTFVSEKGEVLSVAEAGETYLRVQLSNLDESTLTSKYERHKYEIYPRVLKTDRHFQAEFSDVTTAMLTRRLSPLDDSDRWLTPWECNEMLHGDKIHRSVRRALNYHLDAFRFEWVAVTAPTRSAGTPHEHIYLWIDDPGNDVTTDHIISARDKHLKYCTNAYEKHHQYRADGGDRAITIQHDPNLRKQPHDSVATQVIRGNTPPHPNTLGAQYLASQLAHLPLGDYYAKNRQDPPQALFEGAALAWASPYDWLRSSNGVPS